MSNSVDQSTESSGLSPQQRLESSNTRLVDAGIATIKDMETLRACVAYENKNKRRVQIFHRLKRRADEI
ncbi:hypothetical protein [Halohasta litorea]|uniref:DUF8129 domain-containing protein n=1 Tax=Halohasta litorea TaxID=869891 RepID=A0ABD6DF54_9EURY|nr:hypothetical protein [Halohasta litorea]